MAMRYPKSLCEVRAHTPPQQRAASVTANMTSPHHTYIHTYILTSSLHTLPSFTGLTYGEEYYGNFFRSMYTLFQVLTGESWSEVVARPIIFADGTNYPYPYIGGVFYTSYILVCGIVLVNVAVAVLLEKMVDLPEQVETDGINLKELPDHVQQILGPLDLDNDGIIGKEELTHAADLLRADAEKGESAGGAGQTVGSLLEALKTDFDEKSAVSQEDIKLLRTETASREREMLDALHAAAAREELLQSSLATLSKTMEAMSRSNDEKTRERQRRRRTHQAGGSSSSATGGGGGGAPAGTNGSPTPQMAAAAEGRMEDRCQDGTREATRDAPASRVSHSRVRRNSHSQPPPGGVRQQL